jgi:pimeloyl-ACP methyl ester carboxylesterase
MTKPTIIFIPGAWVGPKPYEGVSQTLQIHGYPTLTIPLTSTGKSAPNAPSMHDDIAALRIALLPHVEAEKEIVLVMHSLGGLLGSNAIEGMGIEARAKEGKKGGIKRLVYLAAGILPEGEPHPEDLPLYDRQVRSRLFF